MLPMLAYITRGDGSNGRTIHISRHGMCGAVGPFEPNFAHVRHCCVADGEHYNSLRPLTDAAKSAMLTAPAVSPRADADTGSCCNIPSN